MPLLALRAEGSPQGHVILFACVYGAGLPVLLHFDCPNSVIYWSPLSGERVTTLMGWSGMVS